MHKFGYSYMHSGAISYELKGGATAASPPKSAPATDIWLSFVFYNEGIYELAEQMQLSDEIAIYNDLEGASVPALCFYLKGYDHLCRHIWRFSFFFHFARLSTLAKLKMKMIYGRFHHLVSRYNLNLPFPQKPNYREKTSKTSSTFCCFETPAT